MVTAPNPLNAAALGAEPAVYYSGKVFLAMIVTLGQKLGAPEATPEHSPKDSKNIFERRFKYSTEEKSSNESSFEDSKIRAKTDFEGLQRMPRAWRITHIATSLATSALSSFVSTIERHRLLKIRKMQRLGKRPGALYCELQYGSACGRRHVCQL